MCQPEDLCPPAEAWAGTHLCVRVMEWAPCLLLSPSPLSLLSLPLVLSLFLSSFRPAFPFSPYFLPSFPCCYCCCCCVASVMSDSVRPQRRQPTRLLCPWDSPGKNTGVGCHFLLQCMKVKSEREVAQSCSTLSNPMDCSL